MLNLFFMESMRQWIMFRRYPLEAFAGVAVFTILFISLFAGSRYLAGGEVEFGARMDQVVASYVLWLVTTGLFTGPGSQLVEDARSGILEQLFVTPHNFALFSVMRVVAGLVQHLLLIMVVLTIICLVTGTRLHYSVQQILPFLCHIMAAIGLGLFVSSYAMLVKQVNAILGIGQFILIALVATPISSFGEWGKWASLIVPINPSAQLLQSQLAEGYQATFIDMLFVTANGVFFLGLGIVLLHIASKRAKRLALIGMF